MTIMAGSSIASHALELSEGSGLGRMEVTKNKKPSRDRDGFLVFKSCLEFYFSICRSA
jgi:hypothetical protein